MKPFRPTEKKRRKKIPPAVTTRELEHLARMKRNLARIEADNDEIRKRLGLKK